MIAPLPDNEDERLEAMHQCGVLDTAPEEDYEDITRLAAHICGVPIAAISLIDAERQWFKSIVGLPITETHRDIAFCSHTLLQRGLMVIPDAQADARFADNPLVTGDPHIRFYAGAPLVTADGLALGSLCVIDRAVRHLGPDQELALRLLARLASGKIESARRLAALEQLTADRVRAERAQAQSERRSRTVVEALGQGLMITSLDDTVLYANPRLGEILGYRPAELTGRRACDMLLPPHERDAMLERNRARASGDSESYELRITRKGGGERWVEIHATPYSDDAGEVVGTLASITDITARVRAEEAVRRSEARLAEAQRIAKVGSWEYDIASGRITWSGGLFHLFGMDPAQGEPSAGELMARYHPEDVAKYEEFTKRATQDGLPYECDIRLLRQDGAVRWAHTRGRGERDATGEIVRLFGTFMDITERKETELALAKHRQFQDGLLESLQEGIVACDAKGTLTLFNRASREFHGLPEQPLPPERWAEHYALYGADGRTPLRTEEIPLFRALQGEVVRGAEMVIAPKDGPARTILSSGQSILDAQGERMGAVVAMHDITDRKRVDEALRAQEAHILRSNSILQAQQEAAPDGILIVDENRKIVGYNRRLCELLHTPEEVIQSGDDEKHLNYALSLMKNPEEFLERVLYLYGHPLESSHDEIEMRDGRILDRYSGPVHSGTGQNFGRVWYFRDVTQKRRQEASVRRSEALLAEAQRIARVGSWEYDVATGQMHWSDEMYQILGVAPGTVTPVLEELIARYHPDDVEARNRAFADALDIGKPYEMDIRIVRPDGEVRWCHIAGKPLLDDGGRTARVVVTVMDITERRETVEALRESQRFAHSITEHSTSIIFVFDLDTMSNVYSNRNVGEFLGYPTEQVQARGDRLLSSMLHPDDLDHVTSHFAGFADTADGEVIEIEYRVRHVSGEWRWIWNRETVFRRHEDGTPWQILGTAQDVTERKRAEEVVRRSEARLAEAQRIAQVGSWELDVATGQITWSEQLFRLFGMDPAQGEPDYQAAVALYHPEDSAMLNGMVKRAMACGEGYEADLRGAAGGDPPQWFHTVGTAVTDASGRVVRLMGTLSDITERKQAEQAAKDYAVVLEFQKEQLEAANSELASLATTDGLTGLKNHRAFQERLAEEVSRAGRYQMPLSVVMLDVDHFKAYNDTYGHPDGDGVLRKVARLLQKIARETDVVARYGGEEFVLILPQTDLAGAAIIAERMRVGIADAAWPQRAVTASFGVATLGVGMNNLGDLIARADMALYRSKAAGRNRVTAGAAGEEAAAVVDLSQ